MLKLIVRMAARNTLRNRVRTALTAGMVTLGVALLVIGLTWIHGVFGQMLRNSTGIIGHVRVVNRDYAAREALMPLYDNIPDADRLAKVLQKQRGVVAVMPRITAGVTLTVGQQIGDVFALAVGAPVAYFRTYAGRDDNLVAGQWLSGAKDELMLGSEVAKQLGAKVGQEVIVLGQTQDGALSPIKGKLVGIVAGSGGVDRQLLLPLPRMQWLTDMAGGATELLVYGRDYDDAPQLAAQLSTLGPLKGYLVQPWEHREPWVSMLKTIDSMQGIIIFIIVFLTSLGIWNTMMMSVLERTHEIGVLRAMGLSKLGAVLLFVCEALAIAVVGGAVGLAVGVGPAWLLQTHGVSIGAKVASQVQGLSVSATVYGDLTAAIVISAFLLGLVMAVVGSVLPAWRAARIRPVQAMRSGR